MVFDLEYFKKKYPLVISTIGEDPFTVFCYFVYNGIPNGVQACEEFDPREYRNREENDVLRFLYEKDWEKYYINYIENHPKFDKRKLNKKNTR